MVKVSVQQSDPIGDMLTRVRNANMAYKEETLVPASRMTEAIARILEREGFIAGYTREGEGVRQYLRIRLKYGKNKERTITGLRRVSRPGRRVYGKRDDLPRVLGGLGIAILSTSRGLMTDRQARGQGVGGEVLAYVW